MLNMYSVPDHLIHAIDFVCGIDMNIHAQYTHVKYMSIHAQYTHVKYIVYTCTFWGHIFSWYKYGNNI